jgi:hypothetical protein
MRNMWRQLSLPPQGARQTHPLIGVNPKPGPLGQDIYSHPWKLFPISFFLAMLINGWEKYNKNILRLKDKSAMSVAKNFNMLRAVGILLDSYRFKLNINFIAKRTCIF